MFGQEFVYGGHQVSWCIALMQHPQTWLLFSFCFCWTSSVSKT